MPMVPVVIVIPTVAMDVYELNTVHHVLIENVRPVTTSTLVAVSTVTVKQMVYWLIVSAQASEKDGIVM